MENKKVDNSDQQKLFRAYNVKNNSMISGSATYLNLEIGETKIPS